MAKNFEELIKDLQCDKNLVEAVRNAKLTKDDTDGIIAFAAEHGYTITAEDIKKVTDEELSEEELKKISGGYMDVVDETFKDIFCVVYIAQNYYLE